MWILSGPERCRNEKLYNNQGTPDQRTVDRTAYFMNFKNAKKLNEIQKLWVNTYTIKELYNVIDIQNPSDGIYAGSLNNS